MTHASTVFVTEIQTQAFKFASPIVLALKACEPDLREAALELFEQLHHGELDSEQTNATVALLAEILFPDADEKSRPGLDLSDAEVVAPFGEPDAGYVLAQMDRQEATFADRLQDLMDEKGLSQGELARKMGIGQPAIALMLSRACRPQQRTIQKLAEALEVGPEVLWPRG